MAKSQTDGYLDLILKKTDPLSAIPAATAEDLHAFEINQAGYGQLPTHVETIMRVAAHYARRCERLISEMVFQVDGGKNWKHHKHWRLESDALAENDVYYPTREQAVAALLESLG